ncbi:alcohol acetyltransferase [Mycena galericulata]|nr:alcohol acetyltransferase [Mycena galericulata]
MSRLRQIGNLERYMATRNFLHQDSCVVSSARYTAEDNSALTSEYLFPALRMLIETHASLGVRFDGSEESSDVAFFRLPSIDLSRIVNFSSNEDLRDAMEKHLSRGFDTQGDTPLWRLEVLPGNIVLFAVHHAIGDGLSGAAFHRSLFQALQHFGHPNSTSSSVVQVPEIPMLPPIEDLTDLKPSLLEIIRVGYHIVVPPSKKTWTGNPVPKAPSLKTHVRFVTFSASDVRDLTTACRSHNASITSVLYVLVVCALSRCLLSREPGKGYKNIASFVAISLRGIAGVSQDVMCNYVSIHHAFPPLATEFLWERATRYAAELQAQKQKSRAMVGMLRFMKGRLVDYMQGQLGKKREAGLILSNLGRFHAGPEVEGRWKIGEVCFAQCDVVMGAAFAMNVVGDPTGALNISFSWGETSLDVVFVEAFISLFQESLHDLAA